ncbi:MAG: helix-turn-helix transcriptional regulator [Clostridia bacterium]|nr:helix-turn-helix transcriptional regulator [Clostridia bacterium]
MSEFQETELILGNAKFRFTTDAFSGRPSRSKVHAHTNYELFFVWNGKVTIRTESETFIIDKNQAMIIAPTQYHQSFTENNTKKINMYFAFSRTGKQRGCEDTYSEFERVFSRISANILHDASAVGYYLNQFSEISDSECFGKKDRICYILSALTFSLYDSLNRQLPDKEHTAIISKSGRNYSYEIDSLIAQNLTDDIDLDFIANRLCLSPKRVAVIIKSLYGKSFRTVKTEMRIQLAKQLLRETNLTLSQVASRIGYNSARGFLSAFSKTTKMTPGEYRSRSKK